MRRMYYIDLFMKYRMQWNFSVTNYMWSSVNFTFTAQKPSFRTAPAIHIGHSAWRR